MMFLGTFFTITDTDISAMISKGASLVSDFMPLLVVLVGILIGAFIIRMISRLF
jgi:Na+-translocating ferredoxin:NAD+ oxidoreductase RnfD subunit